MGYRLGYKHGPCLSRGIERSLQCVLVCIDTVLICTYMHWYALLCTLLKALQVLDNTSPRVDLITVSPLNSLIINLEGQTFL